MLASVYRINHICDLLQFFSTVGITSYKSVYSSGSVDWEVVEAGLLSEMFEGRVLRFYMRNIFKPLFDNFVLSVLY